MDVGIDRARTADAEGKANRGSPIVFRGYQRPNWSRSRGEGILQTTTTRQEFEELQTRGRPLVGVGIEGRPDRHVDSFVQPRYDAARRRVVARFLHRKHGQCELGIEGKHAGEQVVKRRGERVDIAARVGGFRIRELFRCHEVRRAQPARRPRQFLILRAVILGEPEVRELHPAVRLEQDVVGLHVAVNDVSTVSILECLSDLRDDADRDVFRKPAVFFDVVAEVAAFDEFVHEVADLAVVLDGERADDVRMFEFARGAKLASQTLVERGVFRELVLHDLDGDQLAVS